MAIIFEYVVLDVAIEKELDIGSKGKLPLFGGPGCIGWAGQGLQIAG